MPAASSESPVASPAAARPAGERAVLRRGVWVALAGVLVLAAALRLSTLGLQSYWFDEGVTVGLLHRGLGGMLRALPHSESTPPLYYVVAWVWARVFGYGEVGLRLLSALAGIGTVAVVFAAGRRIGGPRIALAAGLLAAVNPLLVWYSQEARSYSLLMLLCAGSLLAFLIAEEDGPPRAFMAWAVLSALALATHYFAAFLVGPELVWLLARHRHRRGTITAAGIVIVVALALLPLAIAQRNTKNTDFIGDLGLATRVLQVPKQLLIGYGFAGQTAVAIVAAALTLVAILAALRTSPGRRVAMLPLGLGIVAAVIPVLLAVGGLDYILSRNLIAVWLPFALVIAIGLGRIGRAGIGLLAALTAIGLAVVIVVDASPRYQRDNWRGAIHAATRGGSGPRAIVVNSGVAGTMFAVYAPRAVPLPPAGTPVREVDVLEMAYRPSGKGLVLGPVPAPAPVPGFRLTARKVTRTYALLRYEAAVPTVVPPPVLAAHSFPPQALTFFAVR
jgi:mannosyltransferase